MAKEPGKEVSRWNPFRDEPFFSEGVFRDWPAPFARLARSWDDLVPARASRLAPAVDLAEDEKSFVVTIELPGVKREDVTVELQDDVLSIRGEKKSEREEKKDRSHWVERSYGSFARSFTLPPTAVAEQMVASFKDGVLTIEIPKREQAKSRQISIK
ncbi:MAG: Hsp20/alpha crystallin family protein [Steroidobacteraceae bacterium]